jgi:predicted AAA+ superfamily ATPase
MYKRILDLKPAFKIKSLFLFGPRQTGKTTFLKELFSNAEWLDFLDLDTLNKYNLNPSQLDALAKNSRSKIIVIDEIQKFPALLNQIHKIIEENKSIRFILTGSSMRKLKQKQVNLLGGRATQIQMRPLTLNEILQTEAVNLEKILTYGTLPFVLSSQNPKFELKDYVETYLNQEIKEEALVKNFLNFTKFIDFAAHTNAQLINYTSLGSDAQLPPRTVQDYYGILQDTLVGSLLYPFTKTSRKAVSTSKFYFFDIGVCNKISRINSIVKSSPSYGFAFETLIYNELLSFKSYNYFKDIELQFWRTQTQLEVDFILSIEDKIYAIEVKSSTHPKKTDFKGLEALAEEISSIKKIVVCTTQKTYKENGIMFYSILDFVDKLWNFKI